MVETTVQVKVIVPKKLNDTFDKYRKVRGFRKKEELIVDLIQKWVTSIEDGEVGFHHSAPVTPERMSRLEDRFADAEMELAKIMSWMKKGILSPESMDGQQIPDIKPPTRIRKSITLKEIRNISLPKLKSWAYKNFQIDGKTKDEIVIKLCEVTDVLDDDGSIFDPNPPPICANEWCKMKGHTSEDCPYEDPKTKYDPVCPKCGADREGKRCPNCDFKKETRRRPQCADCKGYHPPGKCKEG